MSKGEITGMKEAIQLNHTEQIELSYLRLKGFKYLVRNEIGSVEVFVNKPHRDKETNYAPYGRTRGGYDSWIETKTPISIEEQRRCRSVELGKYSFISWKDEPILIDDLIKKSEAAEIDRLRKALEEIKRELLYHGFHRTESAIETSVRLIEKALEPAKGEDERE